MATFYLINAVTVANKKLAPGTLVDDGVTPTAPIKAAGGLLWPTLNSYIVAAGQAAVASHARDDATLAEIMQIGANRALKNHDDTENVLPYFVQHPVAGYALKGTSFTIISSALGTPFPTYQWFKNGVAIPGATAANYSITNVTESSAGTYQVKASNVLGTAPSDTTDLIVVTTPVFLNQPTDQLLFEGNYLYIPLNVFGADSYQWYHDGVLMPGETNSVLFLAPVTASFAGSYYLIATNAFGSTQSASGVMTIASAPAITLQPVAQAVATGGTVTFTVEATGTEPLYYQWFHDGNYVGAGTASLQITNAQAADAGLYNVTVANGLGIINSDIVALTVT